MRDTLLRLAWTALTFISLEVLLFRTDLYPSIIEPDSTTGLYETQLGNELRRPKPDPNQVLAVGHSRMALLPRVANQQIRETGYTFSSIALGGTSARVWYYGLRTVDPDANRYAAIWIPVDDYNEPDSYDIAADREADLHYVVRRLGLLDLVPFSLSFHSTEPRWLAFRGILLKSFVFRRDFQQFLANPRKRLQKVRYYQRESAGWYYGFEAEDFSLAGIQVDWERKQVQFPPGLTEAHQRIISGVFFEERPLRTGIETRFLTEWYGRIAGHYRGSRTRLIFFRVPRGPVIRPGQPPPIVPDTAVRRIASAPGVTVLPEDTFNFLEHPEYFGDAMHLNRAGMMQFTQKATSLTAELLRGRP